MTQSDHKWKSNFHRCMAVLAAAFTVGCSTQSISPADVSGPETWGASDNVTRLNHLYFSMQPDEEAFRVAKSRGIATVINLRHSSELDWNEEAAAERQGLRYINIPVDRSADSFDPQTLAAIDAAVSAQKGEPVLLHCSSGNRAAAWLATHLVGVYGLSMDAALAVARRAGLTFEGAEKRVTAYLQEQERR